jgi:hypothetical protein
VDEYDIGYGKPPRATRFAPGKSGNPKGRPKRPPSELGDIVKGVFDASVRYREKGRTRTATRREAALTRHVQRAANGDVQAAEIVLRNYIHAKRHAGEGSSQLLICDWLPDYPGQTAAEKERNCGLAFGSPAAAATNGTSPQDQPPQEAEHAQRGGNDGGGS